MLRIGAGEAVNVVGEDFEFPQEVHVALRDVGRDGDLSGGEV